MAATMQAMVTMGHGDLDVIQWQENWPKPQPAAGEVLVRVGACGLNNTDVNTRSGWYSKAVSEATTGGAYAAVNEDDPTWGGTPITFPRIQGADACGVIEAVGAGVAASRIGERIITDNWLRDVDDPNNMDKSSYFGSECDGGFAQYTVLPSVNAIKVNSSMTDAELATLSCSYSTAEGMLHRANVSSADTVLITGASGGVGSAAIQLAKMRGARVIAMASVSKHNALKKLNPDMLIDRNPTDLRAVIGNEKVTVVVDIVGGDYWQKVIDILERGGRYTCSGAIGGPIVSFDLRTFYLRDLTFTGSTIFDPVVMHNLVKYIEAGQIQPMLAATYPLHELREAQRAFIAKEHVGNIVVTP